MPTKGCESSAREREQLKGAWVLWQVPGKGGLVGNCRELQSYRKEDGSYDWP